MKYTTKRDPQHFRKIAVKRGPIGDEMICFKDKTFCSAMCRNYSCHRHFTDELHMQARDWWDHDPDNVPVAFSDFSDTCPDYKPVKA